MAYVEFPADKGRLTRCVAGPGNAAGVNISHPERRRSLHRRCIFIPVIGSCGLALACLFLASGCGDDSRTTGTQVRISPEVKAALDDMKSAQKDVRAERKAERSAGQKKRR